MSDYIVNNINDFNIVNNFNNVDDNQFDFYQYCIQDDYQYIIDGVEYNNYSYHIPEMNLFKINQNDENSYNFDFLYNAIKFIMDRDTITYLSITNLYRYIVESLSIEKRGKRQAIFILHNDFLYKNKIESHLKYMNYYEYAIDEAEYDEDYETVLYREYQLLWLTLMLLTLLNENKEFIEDNYILNILGRLSEGIYIVNTRMNVN